MKTWIASFTIASALQLPTSAQETTLDPGLLEALRDTPLEQLVSSVSKKTEPQFGAAAAVYVITNEDIRRSGVRSIPEALRLAPGMEVGRIDGTKWAISARGFTDRFSTKLLVLIDGRAVYQTTNGGVYWDVQDTLLEDIDRIEVVRGPGGTLWGANAVNGVVNIITKKATQTRNTYATAGTGTEERGFAAFRSGIPLGENGHLRIYGKYRETDDLALGSAAPFDGTQTYSGGLRADGTWGANELSFQLGGYFANNEARVVHPSFSPPGSVLLRDDGIAQGGHALFRWQRPLREKDQFQFQTYYDYYERRSSSWSYFAHTFDLEAQHTVHIDDRNEFIYGAGYRVIPDRSRNVNPNVVLLPARLRPQLFNGFVQYRHELIEDTLTAILGIKLEHNDYTGFEHQPNVRLAWTPNDRNTVWAAVSRAIRTPARTEHGIILSPPPVATPGGLIFPRGFGDESFDSEKVLTAEVGYRVRPTPKLSLDLAAYYSRYHDINPRNFGPPFVDPVGGVLVLPLGNIYGDPNGADAATMGFELASEFTLHRDWRVKVGYSYFDPRRESPDINITAKASPQNQFFVRSMLNLGFDVDFDVWARFVDAIQAHGIPSYWETDVRLAWRPSEEWELALVGQNLLHKERKQFGLTEGIIDNPISMVQRGVYVQATYQF